MSIGIVRGLRILASQRPTRPSRSVASRDRVTHGRWDLVPVTWIDKASAARGVIVHLHGGAYLEGPDQRSWAWLEELGRRSGVAVALIHVRLPPRFPYPAAIEDAHGALAAMERDLDLPAGRWILSGSGSGGGLALALAQTLQSTGAPMPALLLLDSPWVDLSDPSHGSSYLESAAELYAGHVPRREPRLSPLHGDLADLPPVHLVTGGHDPLRDQAQRLAAAIRSTGGAVDLLEEPDGAHAVAVRERGPGGQRAMRAQIEQVRSALGLDAGSAIG